LLTCRLTQASWEPNLRRWAFVQATELSLPLIASAATVSNDKDNSDDYLYEHESDGHMYQCMPSYGRDAGWDGVCRYSDSDFDEDKQQEDQMEKEMYEYYESLEA
jgi:hypothetical protein